MALVSRIIDDKKFMWDGIEYESEEKAKDAEKDYLEKEFEVRLVKEEGKILLFTRRVVTEIVIEGQP
ncbi:MAG: hypothetical protein JSV33_07990 [bacterium]|nr:MAG: hypothetical protein JSV33_07990 [bacterium]